MEPVQRPELVTAARTAFALASDPAVAAAWDAESACAGEMPIPLLEHYERAAWVTAPADDEANTSIRDTDNTAADVGPVAVLGEIPALIDRLPELLAAPRTPDTVFIPWQGWALATDDFLIMRSMELVVHSDDLAACDGMGRPRSSGP